MAILDQRKESHLEKALADAQAILPSLTSASFLQSELDWSKIRTIEFREAINARDKLLTEQEELPMELDQDFLDVVRCFTCGQKSTIYKYL